jgi:hypothetical protein
MPITPSPLNEGDETHGPGAATSFRVSDLFGNASTDRDSLPSKALPGAADDRPVAQGPAPVERAEAEPANSDNSGSEASQRTPLLPRSGLAIDTTAGDAGPVAATEAIRIDETLPPDAAMAETPAFPAPAAEPPQGHPATEPEMPAPVSEPLAAEHAGPDLPSLTAAPLADTPENIPETTADEPPPAEQIGPTPADDPLSGQPFETVPGSAIPQIQAPGAPPSSAPLLHTEPKEGGRSLSSALDAVPTVEFAPNLTGNYPQPMRAPGGLTSANPQQLASAFGATAKLAADATAAAEALENLKRLLERQLPHPAQASRQQARERLAQTPAAHNPPPLPGEEDESEARPPEVAEHRLPQTGKQTPKKSLPRSQTRTTAVRDPRQFDFRGFMAGFALSWAIGAVLYIYLTAG